MLESFLLLNHFWYLPGRNSCVFFAETFQAATRYPFCLLLENTVVICLSGIDLCAVYKE